MNRTAPLPQRILASVATAATAVLLVVAGAVPASARPDPGETRVIPVGTSTPPCPLERVGAQYVRCDDLTGNGVPAPAWVAES
ncbi:hypothetical protein [Knoellia aerolata]|uniref:Secreted protein n=1 Tax=Knoellia aerolata DSM 18566 TaxID=1385519 RepID=A0A0A0K4X8_9MICO|nr:hypothetical protein [Knoellia aerolata]KGN42891.1 hypothetical protein N801_11525 [Knoellia aerolata DSM 18566]